MLGCLFTGNSSGDYAGQKKLPPIEEFILKAIHVGLTAEAEIAAFLGLEPAIARDAMVNLRMSEDIDLLAPEGLQVQDGHSHNVGNEPCEKRSRLFQRSVHRA
jgi:hypothetical protein